MVDIDIAIEKSKEMNNVSNGGSKCYDFGDSVLIKYNARENQELVMECINKKNAQGVNTPKHIDMRRVLDGKHEVCYVLQEKCKGRNGVDIAEQADTVEKILKNYEYIAKIPFNQYEKLIYDGCMLYEMGYEAKAKNWFYDEETGFWYIDFGIDDPNKVNDKFDFNNPKKIFKTLKHIIPDLFEMSGRTTENYSTEAWNKRLELRNIIDGKKFLASKKVIPLLKKYEKFFLLDKSDHFKQYVMDNELVDCNLFDVTDDDLKTYYELYKGIVDNICSEVVDGTYLENRLNDLEQKVIRQEIPEEKIGQFQSIIGDNWYNSVCQKAQNQSELFNLIDFFGKFVNNSFSLDNFENESEYSRALEYEFSRTMMNSIYQKISSTEPNKYTQIFIEKYELKNPVICEESFKKKS